MHAGSHYSVYLQAYLTHPSHRFVTAGHLSGFAFFRDVHKNFQKKGAEKLLLSAFKRGHALLALHQSPSLKMCRYWRIFGRICDATREKIV